MKKIFSCCMILLMSNVPTFCGTISLVYNLRIAETTKNQFIVFKEKHPSVITVTPVIQFRKTHNDLREFVGGGLGTYIYATDHWYGRVNAAVGRSAETNCMGISDGRTDLDDILFSGGYGHRLNEYAKVTFSAHFGIPTHKDGSLQGIQLGTGHYGLGAQVDGSLKVHTNHALMAALRFIHFFPRNVKTILGPERFNFSIGNLVDLFFTYQGNWERHQLEVGYNPTFLFDASIHPSLATVVKQTDFIASSFYASYRYGFMLCGLPSGIIFGTSYGFDHSPKIFGDKYIVTSWFSFGVKF
jgi:hypothetical protein